MGLSDLLEQLRIVVGAEGEGQPPMQVERVVHAKHAIKGEGAMTEEQAKKYLVKEHNDEAEVEAFIESNKGAGWNANKQSVRLAFEEWKKSQEPPEVKEPEVKEPEVKEPEEKEDVGRSPRLRYNAKWFNVIKETKPRLEVRRIFKQFFDEMSITSFGALPGDFIQALEDVQLPAAGNATLEQEARLKSVLNAFKHNLSKREEPKKTVVKLKVIPKPKTKKATKPRAKVVKPKKGTVRKLVQSGGADTLLE